MVNSTNQTSNGVKKTTCRDLQGPCDAQITGVTPEEMGENGKKHVMEQVVAGDAAHNEAVKNWMQMNKEEQEKWYADFKAKFDTFEDA